MSERKQELIAGWAAWSLLLAVLVTLGALG